MKMRMPDFLVIGAMKCGTTTLYHDLRANPSIYMPDKEANLLLDANTSCQYAAAFQKAMQSQICGDVSADYAMLPESIDVVPRAKRLLGRSVKIIYLVREPVSRTLSHHFHLSVRRGRERLPEDVNRCVREHAALIDCSRYAMQLRPWIDAFGMSAVRVVKFEDFIEQRRATTDRIFQFLGVPAQTDDSNFSTVYNRTAGKPVVSGLWSNVLATPLYRRIVRPLLRDSLRDKMKDWLLPKATIMQQSPTFDTVRYIADRVRDDLEELQQMLGNDRPLWDLEAVVGQYREPHVTVASPGENTCFASERNVGS